MTDLAAVLPGFPIDQYVRLIPSLERHKLTTADLLTLDCVEIAKRASLPLLDVKRLSAAVLKGLHCDLGIKDSSGDTTSATRASLYNTGAELLGTWQTISTLDDTLDHALGGGVPVGYITEFAGERYIRFLGVGLMADGFSGAGKTQFLLSLLLAVQLPAPHGLSAPALYVSTESPLPTKRLNQMLSEHPLLFQASPKPSLDKIISIITPDLESQDHILRYQVPVAIRKFGIRILIVDSIAANYRAEFDRAKVDEKTGSKARHQPGANMAHRSVELVKVGQLLRDLAREYGLAIVVANQVADRFSNNNDVGFMNPSRSIPVSNGSPLAHRSRGLLSSSSEVSDALPSTPISSSFPILGSTDLVSLDHQQRWFTGWGDDPCPPPTSSKTFKTPSLGLVWTAQIAMRVALIKDPVYDMDVGNREDDEPRPEPVLKKWRRWMKVVFAPHVAESGNEPIEFAIDGQGLQAVKYIEPDMHEQG